MSKKEEKVQLIKFVKENILSSSFLVLIHYRGLLNREIDDIRASLKNSGGSIKIIKNTLAKRAVSDCEYKVLENYFSGPVAICYGNDAASICKSLVEKSKEYELLKVVIGYLDGILLEEKQLDSLSKLGSLDEIRSSLVGVIKAVPSRIAVLLKSPPSMLARVFKAYSSK